MWFARTQVTVQIDRQARPQAIGEPGASGKSCCLIRQVQCKIISHMNQNDLSGLAADIKRWGSELGFSAVGITDTDLAAAEQAHHAWLAKGFHGAMDYMAKHGNKRTRPAELVPGTIRIISVRMDYLPPHAKDSQAVMDDGNQAFISRYALGRDYHKVLRQRLQKLCDRIRDVVGDFGYRVFPIARRCWRLPWQKKPAWAGAVSTRCC